MSLTSSAGHSLLRIADLRVDPALDEICKDGHTIKLEPKAMQLLICLADRAGVVVSIQELLDLVWKDVIVSRTSRISAHRARVFVGGHPPYECGPGTAREAVDCGIALPQHERRSDTGVLQ